MALTHREVQMSTPADPNSCSRFHHVLSRHETLALVPASICDTSRAVAEADFHPALCAADAVAAPLDSSTRFYIALLHRSSVKAAAHLRFAFSGQLARAHSAAIMHQQVLSLRLSAAISKSTEQWQARPINANGSNAAATFSPPSRLHTCLCAATSAISEHHPHSASGGTSLVLSCTATAS
jgi:hypothetical protein